MSDERQIDLRKGDLIDGIADTTGTVEGYFLATFRLEEVVCVEVPEDSAEAECLRSGLADKIGKRVLVLMQDNEAKPLIISLKRIKEGGL